MGSVALVEISDRSFCGPSSRPSTGPRSQNERHLTSLNWVFWIDFILNISLIPNSLRKHGFQVSFLKYEKREIECELSNMNSQSKLSMFSMPHFRMTLNDLFIDRPVSVKRYSWIWFNLTVIATSKNWLYIQAFHFGKVFRQGHELTSKQCNSCTDI